MDYKVTDTELTDIADAIREKTGDDSPLEFPSGFIDAIDSIDGVPSGLEKTFDGSVSSGATVQDMQDELDLSGVLDGSEKLIIGVSVTGTSSGNGEIVAFIWEDGEVCSQLVQWSDHVELNGYLMYQKNNQKMLSDGSWFFGTYQIKAFC